MAPFLEQLLKEITGLNPVAHLILETGFVREEWKSLCFERDKSVTASAIQSHSQFAQALVPESNGRVMDRQTRVHLLKHCFRDPNLKAAVPKLNEHRFRPNFFETLERTLTKGRELFAHGDEIKVLEDRLLEKVGFEEKREEFFLLNLFWERLLVARELWDEARLFQDASDRLQAERVSVPVSKVYRFTHFTESPRLRYFWDEVSKKTELVTLASEKLCIESETVELNRKIGHSLEDAAQTFFDHLIQNDSLETSAIVIEDRPEVRRSLKRVSEERGLAFLDPRDPTLFLQSEEIKSALLELELVSKNYSSSLVLSWVGLKFKDSGVIRKKIIEYGISEGLNSYSGISEIFPALSDLKNSYPPRITLAQLELALQGSIQKLALKSWVAQSFKKVILAWSKALAQLGEESVKRPIRFWLEELKERLESSPPLITPMKNERGLKLFRVDQAISAELLKGDHQVHFFGVSARFFEARSESTSWFSNRDIETLSNEFGIPSARDKEAQLKKSFLSWAKISNSAPVFWEYLYDEAGGEQESLEMALTSMEALKLGEPEILPVHPRVLPSLSTHLKPARSEVRIKSDRAEYSVSFLNSLGNCAFTAYAQSLLSLYDERDPDFDLSGDTFGNLVHAAVEALVTSRLSLTPLQAFEGAWIKTAKLAWMKSDRLFSALRKKTISILENFLESELDYRTRSGAEVISQETPFSLKREGFVFKGRVDRIDQHADGIVLIDYKTSGALPSGLETREKLKGLQLPAYALAIQEQMNQEVVGAQYLQLGAHKTNRNLGFLFATWNKSKQADQIEFPISNAKSISNSLIKESPETVWAELDGKIQGLLQLVKEGKFDAVPADPKDCERCRYSIVCGRKRILSEVVTEESP